MARLLFWCKMIKDLFHLLILAHRLKHTRNIHSEFLKGFMFHSELFKQFAFNLLFAIELKVKSLACSYCGAMRELLMMEFWSAGMRAEGWEQPQQSYELSSFF